MWSASQWQIRSRNYVMPDIELDRLRKLRQRAESLFGTLTSDLRPFQHTDELKGFRRKSDSKSPPDDVNVTTTCSCLMSLALSAKLGDFYRQDGDVKTKEIFNAVFLAPWMSSGLAENNAFTTTLVTRLYGFLMESGILSAEAVLVKPWEASVAFFSFDSFAKKLVAKGDALTTFLFGLFPSALQEALLEFVKTGVDDVQIEKDVAAELERLIRTTNFCQPNFLTASQAKTETTALLNRGINQYTIPTLNRRLLHDCFESDLTPLQGLSMEDIAHQMSEDADRFKINNYDPAAAVVYWFVDGVARAQIDLLPQNWDRLCRFAVDEFGRQRSRVVARDAATMDPVAMAMSACLCARLRSISKELRLGMNNNHHSMLPSTVELESAVVDLFAQQTPSGIWPKYFPLFHYQDAGSNFCFTFELLEAILVEFGGEHNRLLTEEAVILGLERAVHSCESNRLQYSENESGRAVVYEGWNSGGNLQTLRRGQPESWATAVVHMFLWELIEVLSRRIQLRLLENYTALKPTEKSQRIDDLLDIDIHIDGKPESLKATLFSELITTFKLFPGKSAEKLRKTPAPKGRLSALLFGPPGTSKTQVAKAIAAELKWPLVEIDPSHFLQDSFENIYVQAEKTFEDVMDLCGVVVLFDEMDALVQKRDGEHIPDTASKFLTTYMLPKLAKLHDRRQIIFLMATNFPANFDDAIKRAGRFDLLLCMGPPTLTAKANSVHRFLGCQSNDATKQIGEYILNLSNKDSWVEDQLNLYTFGDFKSFVERICAPDVAGGLLKLKAFTTASFRSFVEEDCKTVGLKLEALTPLFNVVRTKNRRLTELDSQDVDNVLLKPEESKVPVIKYVRERQQSKKQ